ncbi:hypothetical protein [Streptomyces sp. NPDC046197]|uniref:hypothetical protein n=1 Tax=Streptomyces sp. NPDC046197 TaxID=3154337 RepID=UPI0033D4D309
MTSPVGDWPLPSVVPLGTLGPLGTPLSKGDGQSKSVSPLTQHQGWLAKLYNGPLDTAATTRLDTLVALPGAASDTDCALLRSSTSWPVARITDQGATVGCVIPTAPPNFRVTIQASATSSLDKHLEIDWLAMPDATLVGRGVRAPSPQERLKVCRSVVAVAACLERHRIVYSDWSYSNAFWDPLTHAAYVIDVDGCGQGTMPNIFQPNWEDPLTPRGTAADGGADRFRVALLTARCLTGVREAWDAVHVLPTACDRAGAPGLSDVLLDMLLAADRRHRPTLDTLHSVMLGRPYFRLKVDRVSVASPAAAPPQADAAPAHQNAAAGPPVTVPPTSGVPAAQPTGTAHSPSAPAGGQQPTTGGPGGSPAGTATVVALLLLVLFVVVFITLT